MENVAIVVVRGSLKTQTSRKLRTKNVGLRSSSQATMCTIFIGRSVAAMNEEKYLEGMETDLVGDPKPITF